MTDAQRQTPVAVVTGASYGIGAATAHALARAGYDIAITDIKTDTLRDTSEKIEDAGRKVMTLPLDLRSQDSIEALTQKVIGQFENIDLLVNNAGVPQRKAALDVTRDDWAAVMDVNLTGSFFMCQSVGRHFIASHRKGCIVSVASTHGMVGLSSSSAYGISKAGVIHMTRMLAIEWAEYGIRVNAIAPASTPTPSRAALYDPAHRDLFLNRIPLNRLGDADEMAAAIVYLASPNAAFITGQTLALDGGLTSY